MMSDVLCKILVGLIALLGLCFWLAIIFGTGSLIVRYPIATAVSVVALLAFYIGNSILE